LQDVINPVAKLKNGRLNSKRRRFAFLFFRLLPLETEENHLQKKGNAAQIVSAQPGENIDRLVYHDSQTNQVSLNPRHAAGFRIKTHH
jgi:hypothetical protein